jgi:hypothetical protein
MEPLFWPHERCRENWMEMPRLRASALLFREGGYLRLTGQLGVMLAAYGKLPRPESWFPYVFTSLDDAVDFMTVSR